VIPPDRLGRSTANLLDLAKDFRERGIGLRVLNLGGGDVDTGTPMGSLVFTVMAALAQMELEIKRERFTNSQIDSARRLIGAGQPAAQVARDLGMYRRIAESGAQHWITTQG